MAATDQYYISEKLPWGFAEIFSAYVKTYGLLPFPGFGTRVFFAVYFKGVPFSQRGLAAVFSVLYVIFALASLLPRLINAALNAHRRSLAVVGDRRREARASAWNVAHILARLKKSRN